MFSDNTAGAEGYGEYAGWLLKAAPRIEDTDKMDSLGRRLRSAANILARALRKHGDFKARFFVLDGTELRYYSDETMRNYCGTIDLGTVLDVRYADRQGVPAFAVDLVSARCCFPVPPSLLRAVADAC
jgi:hypothetical protein